MAKSTTCSHSVHLSVMSTPTTVFMSSRCGPTLRNYIAFSFLITKLSELFFLPCAFIIAPFWNFVKGFLKLFSDYFTPTINFLRSGSLCARRFAIPLTIIILSHMVKKVNYFFKKIFVKFLTCARAKSAEAL